MIWCRETGKYKRDYTILKNPWGSYREREFLIGARDAIHDLSTVTGTFLVNGLYVTILFDLSVEKSFITSKFRKLLTHKSRKLNEPHLVEMVNSKSNKIQEILENCLITSNNLTIHINLMPMNIRSFDVIISMDWLSIHQLKYYAMKNPYDFPYPTRNTDHLQW